MNTCKSYLSNAIKKKEKKAKISEMVGDTCSEHPIQLDSAWWVWQTTTIYHWTGGLRAGIEDSWSMVWKKNCFERIDRRKDMVTEKKHSEEGLRHFRLVMRCRLLIPSIGFVHEAVKAGWSVQLGGLTPWHRRPIPACSLSLITSPLVWKMREEISK